MNAPVERGLIRALPAVAHDATQDVFLLPGEWWFGGTGARVSTLLGSCVAVVLWHPQRRIGGMCHFLVPGRTRPAGAPLDGSYGDEAVALLARAVAGAGSRPAEYRVHLTGGANMFPDLAGVTLDVGARNAEEGAVLLAQHGFAAPTLDIGGTLHRRIELDLTTGRTTVRAGA